MSVRDDNPRVRRLILPCAPVLAVVLPAGGSDARRPTAGAAGQAVYRLPRDADPEHLALSGDGSVWLTVDFGGPVWLRADGRTKEFPVSEEDDSAADVAVAADGAMWFTEPHAIGRISADGRSPASRWRAPPSPTTSWPGATGTSGSPATSAWSA